MQLIQLDASPSSDLLWESNEEGIYYLDFDLKKQDLFDDATFNANRFAIEEFVKQFPKAKQVILGSFNALIPLSFANQLSDYLHHLASFLPDEIEPCLHFDIRSRECFADYVLLLCKRRFEYFSLLFSHISVPIEGEYPICVALPQDLIYEKKTWAKVFSSLEGLSYKCIPEELLNEHWEGVDTIIINEKTLSETGMRMIEGFKAAGGKITRTYLTKFLRKFQ